MIFWDELPLAGMTAKSFLPDIAGVAENESFAADLAMLLNLSECHAHLGYMGIGNRKS
jgi:hypothetical protein